MCAWRGICGNSVQSAQFISKPTSILKRMSGWDRPKSKCWWHPVMEKSIHLLGCTNLDSESFLNSMNEPWIFPGIQIGWGRLYTLNREERTVASCSTGRNHFARHNSVNTTVEPSQHPSSNHMSKEKETRRNGGLQDEREKESSENGQFWERIRSGIRI